MARPIPAEEPVTTATLLSSCTMHFLPVFQRQVQKQRRRPREVVRAVSRSVYGVEVLVEPLVPTQADDGLPQVRGVLVEAVALWPPHQQPVYVDPDGTPPV